MHLRAFHFLLVSNFIVSFWSAPAFSQAKPNPDDVISWIEKNGGEFDRDQSRIEKPIIKLRLDRTRGIDPGFYRDTLEDAGLQRLAELPELEQLNLENRTTFTDKGLLYLASLRNLRSLNLSRTSINGVGLNHLTKLMKLTELDLSACHRLNDESMGHLKRLQQLTSIRLDATSSRWVSDSIWSSKLLRAANLRALPANYGRSELDELRGGISDDGLRQILGMRNLKELSIGTTRITDAGTRDLSQLEKLESLDISRTAITDASLDSISQLTQLKSLKLNFVGISNEGLHKLARLERLEELELRGTPITTSGIRALTTLPMLRRLDLSMTQANEDVLNELVSMPHLNDVNLSGINLSLQGLVRFAKRHPNFDLQKTLRSSGKITADATGTQVLLSLQDQQIGDHDLALIQDFSQLSILNLDRTNVTDRGLVHLQKLTNLKRLSVNGTTVSFDGLHDLFVNKQRRTLGELFSIVGICRRPDESADHEENFLDLRHLSTDASDLSVISEYQPATSLFLAGNRISDADLVHLARLKNLRRLWLSGAELTGRSLSNFGPSRIQELFLTDTSVSDDDLRFLGKHFPLLQVLNLSGTLKSDRGVQHLLGLKDLRVLIVDVSVLSQPAIDSLKLAHPNLLIVESEVQALREIRGSARNYDRMPEGIDRVREMAGVDTKISKSALIPIYGDAYFEVADRLSCQGKVRACHRWADLKSLRVLHLVSIVDMEGCTAFLKDLTQLVDLSFYRSGIHDEDLARLSSLPNLESLDLQDTPVTGKGLDHIRALKTLKKLSLGGYQTNIGDEGMNYLAGLTNLEVLELNRTSISDASLVHLKDLRNLKSISLREVPVDQGLKHLSSLENLETLDLYSTLLSDETAESFSSFPNLKRISVEQTMLSEAGIQRLRECAAEAQIHFGQLMSSQTRRALEPLARLRATVYRNSSAEVYMVDLRDLKDVTAAIPCVFELRETLTDLRLGKHATDQLLADLKQLPALSTVDLSDSQLSNAGLSHLKGCPQLKTLVLQRCTVDNAGLASILAVPDLAALVLNGSSLPEGAYARIGSMPQLRRLEFSKSSISDSDLAHLARLPSLNCLVLDHTKITAQGMKQLETHVHLQKLSLVGTKVTDNDLRQLREAIPECEFVLQ